MVRKESEGGMGNEGKYSHFFFFFFLTFSSFSQLWAIRYFLLLLTEITEKRVNNTG